MSATPKAPTGLAARGRRFWRETTTTYVLNEDELELLVEVCRTLDECDALHLAIRSDGVTVAGSKGQTRAHPALTELRGQRLALGRLVAQLQLPDPDGRAVPSLRSVQASRASRARWQGGGPGGAA